MTKVDDIEKQLTQFAADLGETRGKLDSLDERVRHNCQRNEENFKRLDDTISELSNNVIVAISQGVARDQSIQTQMSDLNENQHQMSVAITKRSMALWAILVATILAFIGGSLVNWNKVGGYFERTTAGERAETVKQVIETASKLTK